MDINTVIAVAGFFLGIGSSLIGLITWYSNSEKKRYAAERDFNHLKRNYEQLTLNLKMVAEEIDDFHNKVMQELVEIKALAYRQLTDRNKG